MLILRRKAGETLLIGDEIRITVLDVYEGGVRLAIDAPKRIAVLRSELLQAADANRDAANDQNEPRQLLDLLGGDEKARMKPEGTESGGTAPKA